jgi:hypothetical protein
MADTATLENPARVLRDCWLHFSGRESSPVRHDNTPEDCMTVLLHLGAVQLLPTTRRIER